MKNSLRIKLFLSFGIVILVFSIVTAWIYVSQGEAHHTGFSWRLLYVALSGVVVALIVSYFLANGILIPLKQLERGFKQVAGGDMDCKVKIKSWDEICKLGESFNSMVALLRARDEQLREQASRTIMESDRLATVGQLAAGVAHELNNPLGGILLYSNLLLENAAENDSAKDDLKRIISETERCRKIVKGLLDFSHQTKPEVVPVDFNNILANTLNLAVNQPIFHDIKVVRDFDPFLPKVMMDIGQMQQVCINVILNAAEAMEGSGSLTVTTFVSEDKKFINAVFKDTGPGIAKENLEKVFDPFFTTKPRGVGTGLGLSITWGIIRRHKGIIKIESDEGNGTVVGIKLPVTEKREM